MAERLYRYQCSRCGQLLTEFQLIKIICIRNPVNGSVTKRVYHGEPFDALYAYVVDGCPDCLTDTVVPFSNN